MKLDIIDEDNFEVFLSGTDNNINYESKEELVKFLKDIIVKFKKYYKVILTGFYEVHICIINNIGMRLTFKKLDDYMFSDKLIDLKIVIELNPDVYLKFNDYDIVSNYRNIKYNEGNYYIKVSEINKGDALWLSEFYEIIYDGEFLNNLKCLDV